MYTTCKSIHIFIHYKKKKLPVFTIPAREYDHCSPIKSGFTVCRYRYQCHLSEFWAEGSMDRKSMLVKCAEKWARVLETFAFLGNLFVLESVANVRTLNNLLLDSLNLIIVNSILQWYRLGQAKQRPAGHMWRTSKFWGWPTWLCDCSIFQ